MIQSHKKEIEKKDKEINRLKELSTNKNKLSDKKPEEIFKFSKNINISDIKELKQHYDSEKLFLSDLIETLKKDIEKKNELIEEMNKELDISRTNLELEKKLNMNYFQLNSPLLKLNTDKLKIDYHRISCENISLKLKLLDSEEKLDFLTKNNESLIQEKENIEKNIKEKNNFYQNILKKMKNSYDKLIQNMSKISNKNHE